jgi:hypothetical protein
MPHVSRPIFDWSEDPDARGGAAPDDALDDEPDDGADDGADDADPDDVDLLDDEFPVGDGVAEDAATVWCPYCGEASEVALDPGGGAQQTYVEDCPVCCRPWRVTVSYQPDGTADVWAQTDDE